MPQISPNPKPAPDTTLKTDEYLINMGPQHPSTHGVLRLVLRLDGETVLQVVPHVGYIHRSMEKMAENDAYPQIVHLTDRQDYLSAMLCNWAYSLAVERLMGLAVPERAEHLRVIVGELNRVASHLLWYGAYGMDLGAVTAFFWGFREREEIVDLFEELCGQRLTYNYVRIGGVAEDIPKGFKDRVREIVGRVRAKMPEYHGLLAENVIFQQRTRGIGKLDTATALSYGCSGPVLRSTGLSYDLRKDEPYSIYKSLRFEVPVGTVGDCWDRYLVRMAEMRESLSLVEQALDAMPEGPVMAKLPRVLKPPAGEVYSRLETARGDMGVYLVSDGGPKPLRCKFRSACFSNLSVLPALAQGWKVADVISILGSLDLVIPDVDR